MSERNEISRHEVEVFRILLIHHALWLTNQEIAAQCVNVAARTVRGMTKKLVDLGLVDQAEVFPAHKFKLAPKAENRNRGYLDRLRKAFEVFGLNMNN